MDELTGRHIIIVGERGRVALGSCCGSLRQVGEGGGQRRRRLLRRAAVATAAATAASAGGLFLLRDSRHASASAEAAYLGLLPAFTRVRVQKTQRARGHAYFF